MSSLHTEHEAPEEFQTMSRRNDPEQDREISLNTSTILLLFFALALVCSAFFGLGYTMGRKTTPPTTYTAAEDHTDSLRDAFKSFKPAPGGPSATKFSTPPAPSPTSDDAGSSTSISVPATTAKAAPLPVTKKPFDPDAEIVTEAPASKPVPATHTPSPVSPTPALQVATSTATVIVQVAAVSHQEDADTMLSALKRKGYSVTIHQEPQDHLLHLQLGPYPSKKDAEAMRARLLADGYNSILK